MKVPSLFKTVEGWMLAIVVASLLAFSGSLWLKINYGYNGLLRLQRKTRSLSLEVRQL